MEQVLVSAAKQLEQQLDSEISRLDNLGTDDIEAIRDRRLKEMKSRQEKLVQWKQNVKKKTWWAIEFVLTFHVSILGTRRILRVGRREGILRSVEKKWQHCVSFLPRRSRTVQDRRQAFENSRHEASRSSLLQSQRREVSIPHTAPSHQSHSKHRADQRQQDKRLHRWVHGPRQLRRLQHRDDGVENRTVRSNRLQRRLANSAR